MPVAIHIIEDDSAVRDAVRELVAGQDRHVFAFATPTAFFAEAQISPQDIIVLDLHFPVGSGVEIASRLRREHPGVKIIIISGVRLGLYSQALAAIAPTASFRKPLDGAAFADCVNRLAAT